MDNYFKEYVDKQTNLHKGKKKMKIIKDFLEINEYSRPGFKLNDLKAVAIHWVENPGTSAKFNRNYFAIDIPKLKKYASAQYIIGLQGEILQTMEEDERAYAVGWANRVDPISNKPYTDFARNLFGNIYCEKPYSPSYVTISIELCHLDKEGRFTKETINSAEDLITDIFKRNSNKLKDPLKQIVRHYDIVGWKDCPRWFVNNPFEFENFKERIKLKLI